MSDLVHTPLKSETFVQQRVHRFDMLWKKKVRHVKILAHCGMLRHASKPPPTAPRIWRCGMLRHAAAVAACYCRSIGPAPGVCCEGGRGGQAVTLVAAQPGGVP